MTKATYEIDGSRFSTLDEFLAEIERVLIPGAEWGRSLDAFNDILRGGFGTPDGGFVLRWRNADLSRERLGYPETIRYLQRQTRPWSLGRRRGRQELKRQLEFAERGEGATVFDWLVEIIRRHGADGEEEEDGVELILA